MLLWEPDFCPPGRACLIELVPDWSAALSFKRCCPHHQALRNQGFSDQQVFEAILQSSRVKEAARAAAKSALGLDKEFPGLPFSVGSDGKITVQIGGWQKNGDGTFSSRALNAQDRAAARAASAAAAAKVHRPIGTQEVEIV